MNYLDFELEIGPGAGREYPVAVVRSPAGEARETMRFPFDELALENRLKDLQIALLRSGGQHRNKPLPEEQAVQDFGRALFDALFTGDVRSRYDMSWHEATQKEMGLRLKLRIQSPQLATLPWEFLYDSRQAEYVCLSRNTPIVRYVEIPQPIQPFTVAPPLRILGMAVSPDDPHLGQLDLRREKQRVEEATKHLRERGVIELTWLQGQTWRDLQKAMRAAEPWHIFHFIGHGGFDKHTDEGLIYLADETGESERLTATNLGRLLADHRSLRLVLLNACEGARGSDRDLFSSTAAILVRRGLPAVLAMQYEITDRAAIEFSREFYDALAEGNPVDTAVVEARKSMSVAVTNTIEWGTPVLYMRAPDGRIFDIERQPLAAVEPERVKVKSTPAPHQPGVEKEKEPFTQPPPEIKPRRSNQRPIMIAAMALALIVLTYFVVINLPSLPPKESPKEPPQVASDSLYRKHKNAGDSLFILRDFDNAKRRYQLAWKQKPNDRYATARIDSCDQRIALQKNLVQHEKLYAQYMKDGNNLYQSRQYEEAKSKFEKALEQKPDDKDASNQIKACDEKIAEAERERLYSVYIQDGDRFFNQKNFKEAKRQYEKALEQKPRDRYAINRKEECEQQIAGEEEEINKVKLYTANKAEGDTLFRQGNSEEAKQKYKIALQYTANDAYLTRQIQFCNEMVFIVGGAFKMGSTDGDNNHEKPEHQVYVEAFYMDKFEVTVAHYQQFLETNPQYHQPEKWNEQKQYLKHPVVYVDWNDAFAYAKWARKRLPTEAEWEYAARGGNTGLNGKPKYKYPWGDEASSDKANFDLNSNRGREWENAKRELKDVGKYSPNDYNLYDMAGNVSEWCMDWYGDYQNTSQSNPHGPADGTYRLFRGGSWGSIAQNIRCANRSWEDPSKSYHNLGFRCVLSVR